MVTIEVGLEYDGGEPEGWQTCAALDPAESGRIIVRLTAWADGLVRMVTRPVGAESILWRGEPRLVRAGDTLHQEFSLSS